MLVSIIMPAYNAEETIKESIQSVINQTYGNWELLVVNDGSSDNTVAIIESYEDARIKLINQKNSGVSSARNNALRQAIGEYVSFLDSDDLWVETKLEVQMQYLQENNLKFVYSKSYSFLNDSDNIKKAFKFVKLDFKDREEILIYDFIPILTVVFHKSILKEVGLFDESLQGTEDWDLWIRVLQKYEAGLIDKYLAKYRIATTGLSKNFPKHFTEEEKVFKKHNKLYTPLLYKYRAWFSNKKQCIIALQNKDYFKFVKYFVKLLLLPNLLLKFILMKYSKQNA
jgi:glycosyltransferase involved in cell wall biosynthesis